MALGVAVRDEGGRKITDSIATVRAEAKELVYGSGNYWNMVTINERCETVNRRISGIDGKKNKDENLANK